MFMNVDAAIASTVEHARTLCTGQRISAVGDATSPAHRLRNTPPCRRLEEFGLFPAKLPAFCEPAEKGKSASAPSRGTINNNCNIVVYIIIFST